MINVPFSAVPGADLTIAGQANTTIRTMGWSGIILAKMDSIASSNIALNTKPPIPIIYNFCYLVPQSQIRQYNTL